MKWLKARRTRAAAEEEQGYRYQAAQFAGATAPRARYIIEQQRATLRDTPFGRGARRATLRYLAREPGTEGR